jgi:hypothetical protein
MRWPWTSAVRKCRPAQTRASTISWIACEKRAKLRVRPALLVSVQAISSVPKNCWSVLTIEPLIPVCAEGWSGYGGVATSGVQSACGYVSGLPSPPASRIAVIGRQNDQYALSSQTAISASAPVM